MADGSRSAVRHELGAALEPHITPYTAPSFVERASQHQCSHRCCPPPIPRCRWNGTNMNFTKPGIDNRGIASRIVGCVA
jgi:hypothetical protein